MSTSRSPIKPDFERFLLISISSRFTEAKGMKKIQEARRRSDRVRRLLEMLGDDRKNPPAGHALRGCFYSSTRPLPSRRGFARGVAERNDPEEVLAKDFRTGPSR